jgi:hypothetical protein
MLRRIFTLRMIISLKIIRKATSQIRIAQLRISILPMQMIIGALLIRKLKKRMIICRCRILI